MLSKLHDTSYINIRATPSARNDSGEKARNDKEVFLSVINI